jgi:putative transposase
MGRALRQLSPDGCYHVMARSNSDEPLFRDDEDRVRFLGILDEVVLRRSWIHMAYCLMSNHFHAVLQTPDSDLSDGMRELLGTYARTFNLRHNRAGHLFRERFLCVVVTDDDHLLTAVRYVVRNPVTAGITPWPDDWKWSSCRHTLSDVRTATSLNSLSLLERFAPDPIEARRLFRAFIFDDAPPPPVEHAQRRRSPTLRTLQQALGTNAAIVAAVKLGYKTREIAKGLGLSPSSVSHRRRRQQRARGTGC